MLTVCTNSFIVELKPTHFPPLPNQQPTPSSPTLVETAAAAAKESSLTPPTRSAAEIVKSTVVARPKKPITVAETPKNSAPKVEASTNEDEQKPQIFTKETPPTTTPFSYADALKKKDN
ncbi:hypothetical protein BD408DRAFT_10475 [Parasitella parasitica]|nr:hypothetical protein BD408DRAFT_10475 [Parasitella parasitica]